MTKEEYEIKVQSMPQELQKSFRESLEITASKRIVNRFMSTVMQAYKLGQRDHTGGTYSRDYILGASDMKQAIETVFEMTSDSIRKYFGGEHTSTYYVLQNNTLHDILETVKCYREDEENEKAEQEITKVKEMAATVGIDKLCQIVEEIRKEITNDDDGIPFA